MRRKRTRGEPWDVASPNGERPTRAALRAHLVASRLAGEVQTSPANTLTNCRKLVDGDVDYTFGLSDWRSTTFLEVVSAIREVCGGDPGGAELSGPGYIDPDAAIDAVEHHRDRLGELAEGGGGRVLLATGHPTGLLAHYGALARGLQASGSELLAPLDDTTLHRDEAGHPRGLRFLDGVASVSDGASLRHTHVARYMEAMLTALGSRLPDLVIADHGMAGAAIEAGVPTLSIADVNDPALPLAQVRGRTAGVLPIDDNLAPRLFVPVTEAMLPQR